MNQMVFTYQSYTTSLESVFRWTLSVWAKVDIGLMILALFISLSIYIIKPKKGSIWDIRTSVIITSWIEQSKFVMPFIYLYYQAHNYYYYYFAIGQQIVFHNDTLFSLVAIPGTDYESAFVNIGHDSIIDPNFMNLISYLVAYYIIAIVIIVVMPLISYRRLKNSTQ